ncbi:AAA family ATPase [Rhizorhabdus dicambivorans]|uniref:NadR/Ttd14 AAA domain-containing protein n=1 Tax=Rhizorhabdus dicambivorans TaxID=1850238 RepID=A0A2A4FX74_9SPHN|nr:ATP-binding protein [Rhizorhabdus dicambivorans]ATE65933.1 hypothetical protein CMV14_17250 [Rhizorhabdus dicambivorans]PCE43049.1 hypothetical protein COO09_07035 [Rhizorhabdus dicambivorans]
MSAVGRIALLGGESSGKSTLAAGLATRLDTLWVEEYGRELWVKRDGALDFEDLLHIGEVQVIREDKAAARAKRFLFCDTTPLVTAFYSQALFGRVDPRLAALAERRYDHSLLCAPDFPFVQDGWREDSAFRQQQHDFYEAELVRTGQPFTLIRGPIDARIETALAAIGA